MGYQRGVHGTSFILCFTSTSILPSTDTCDPKYLKDSTSSSTSPFNTTFILPSSTTLVHLITLLLFSLILNFLLVHTLPKPSTSCCNSSSSSSYFSSSSSFLPSFLLS